MRLSRKQKKRVQKMHAASRSYVRCCARDQLATDSVRSKLPPLYVPVSPVARLP